MSQDDRNDDARMRDRADNIGGDNIDDGMIHEWLDGELDAVQAAELEALVASSPRFAARVAEARGLLAASSRILSSLDHVPRNVLAGAAASEAPPLASPVVRPLAPAAVPPNAPHIARTGARGWSARRWAGIAALLMVGVTGVVVARREPETVRVGESAAIAAEGAADAQAADAVIAADAARAAVATRSDTVFDQKSVATTESAPTAGAPMTSGVTASAQGARVSVPQASPAPLMVAGRVATTPSSSVISNTADAALADSLSARLRLRAPALQQGTPIPANARAEKVADAPAQIASARIASGAAASVQGGAPMRRMLSAGQSAAFEVDAAPPSDIVAGDLLLAVQRVSCAPGCVQLRIEIARDGRVRRWRQSLGASGSPDTATLSERALADLSRTVAELRLDTLPAMLRLDGAQCRSVGSLRESLRVEFVHNDELRRVMGLPWCSDGTHVMDKAAAAIEAAAESILSRVSGASSRYW